MVDKDTVWVAFHETIPALELRIKELEEELLRSKDEEMVDGFSVKAHTRPPEGDQSVIQH